MKCGRDSRTSFGSRRPSAESSPTTFRVNSSSDSRSTASPRKHGASTTSEVSSAGAIASDRFFGSQMRLTQKAGSGM